MWSAIFKGELGLRDIFLAVSLVATAVHFGFNNVYFALAVGVMVFLSERLYREGVSISRATEALKYSLIGAVILGFLAWLNNQSIFVFINDQDGMFTKTFCSLPFTFASYGIIELVFVAIAGETTQDDDA